MYGCKMRNLLTFRHTPAESKYLQQKENIGTRKLVYCIVGNTVNWHNIIDRVAASGEVGRMGLKQVYGRVRSATKN